MALWRSSLSQRSRREAHKLVQWIGESSNHKAHPSSAGSAVHAFTGQSAAKRSCSSIGTRCLRIQEVSGFSPANNPQAAATTSGTAAALLRSLTRSSLSSQRRLSSTSSCGVPTPRSTTRSIATGPYASAPPSFSTRQQHSHLHRTAAPALTLAFVHAPRALGVAASGAPRWFPFTALSRSVSQAAPAALAAGQAAVLDASVGAAAASAGTKGSSMYQQLRGHLRSYYELSKTRLSLLVVATAAAGFVMGSGEHVDWALCARTCLGTFLAAASANSFNQAWEVHSDAAMKRTCRRPLPSGRISRPHALLWATAAGASGVLLLLPPSDTSSTPLAPSSSVEADTGSSSAPATILPAYLAASNIGLYALVYTPLKQIHPINTWVGALVGAIPPLIGWSAASGESLLSVPAASGAWLWATVLLFWQMPHFHALSWLCREDYRRGGYKMLSVVDPTGRRAGASALVNCLLLLPLPALSSSLGVTSPEFAVGATAISLAFAAAAFPFYRAPSPATAKTLFRLSLMHLPAYMAAMTAFRVPHATPLNALAAQPLAQAQDKESPMGAHLTATTEQQPRRDEQEQKQRKQEAQQHRRVVQSRTAAAEGDHQERRMARAGGRLSLGPPLHERAPPVAYASAAPFPFLPLPI